jgi:ribosome biogenesis protein SSF1/2
MKRSTAGRSNRPPSRGNGPRTGGRSSSSSSGGKPGAKTPKLDENAVSLLQKVPRTMIFRRGNVGDSVKSLIEDLRWVMSPNTAKRLKERKKNNLQDFLRVASALHVSHFMTLTQTALALHLRISRLPRGPTVIFRVLSFSTMNALRATQKQPNGYGAEYNNAPLVVLNNFNMADDSMKITTATLQNMFPGLDLANIKLSSCRRVVLFHYDNETDTIQFRHFLITAVPVGLTRSVRKIVMGKLPSSLHDKDDIADYLNDPNLSESESEMNQDIRVSLAQNIGGRGNKENHTSAIKLKELGPRMTLELYKIEDGFNDGRVLYNRYVEKTEEEIKILDAQKEYNTKVKEQRRQTQQDNILRKQREQLEHRQDQIDKMNASRQRHAEMNDADDDDDMQKGRHIDQDGDVSIGDFDSNDDDDNQDDDDDGYYSD